MAAIDLIYHNLLRDIMNEGYDYVDPNRKKQGVQRRQINKFNFDYKMAHGFPALTTKRLAWKSVVGETLWFLRGDTNIKYLLDNGIPIWNKDAYNFYLRERLKIDKVKDREPVTIEEFVDQIKKKTHNPKYGFGYVGKNYGYQLRHWTGKEGQFVDQLQNLIITLRTNPMATKKIVTYWNPAESKETALTPCHRSWEVMVRPLSLEERRIKFRKFPDQASHPYLDTMGVPKYELSLSFDMSSVDVFLGLPFNIASYGLILQILSYITNMAVGTLSGNLTNVHIYHSHLDAVKEQLERDPFGHRAPKLNLGLMLQSALANNDLDLTLDNLAITDFKLDNYTYEDSIRAEMLAYDE